MTERYHAGWNEVPIPATEALACHLTWNEAAEALKERMRSWADEDDDAAMDEVDWDLVSPDREQEFLMSDEAPHMLAHVQAILRDDPPVEPKDYLAVVDDRQLRLIAFWLLRVDCDHPDHLIEQESTS